MASAFTHPLVAGGLYVLMPGRALPGRVLAAGLLLSVAPDMDVVGFALGVPYEHMLGHRGITHSLPFAALLAVLLAPLCATDASLRRRSAVFLFLATGSHGLLDALTNGGLGIALLAPFTATRWFAPWQPIEVSPIGVTAFFGEWGLRVMVSELLWIWLPVVTLCAPIAWWRWWPPSRG